MVELLWLTTNMMKYAGFYYYRSGYQELTEEQVYLKEDYQIKSGISLNLVVSTLYRSLRLNHFVKFVLKLFYFFIKYFPASSDTCETSLIYPIPGIKQRTKRISISFYLYFVYFLHHLNCLDIYYFILFTNDAI